jgi:hypothetical protein
MGPKEAALMYRLLDGQTVDLSSAGRKDMGFLLGLMRRALEEEDYFSLEREVCSRGAYPLKGSPRVTREIHDSALFRVAQDIAFRAGIRQGVIAPARGEPRVAEEIMSVTDAARKLGVTRSAVIKAARTGRIQGKKIGHTWALLRRSVESYEVAHHRVEAGRAAHRGR